MTDIKLPTDVNLPTDVILPTDLSLPTAKIDYIVSLPRYLKFVGEILLNELRLPSVLCMLIQEYGLLNLFKIGEDVMSDMFLINRFSRCLLNFDIWNIIFDLGFGGMSSVYFDQYRSADEFLKYVRKEQKSYIEEDNNNCDTKYRRRILIDKIMKYSKEKFNSIWDSRLKFSNPILSELFGRAVNWFDSKDSKCNDGKDNKYNDDDNNNNNNNKYNKCSDDKNNKDKKNSENGKDKKDSENSNDIEQTIEYENFHQFKKDCFIFKSLKIVTLTLEYFQEEQVINGACKSLAIIAANPNEGDKNIMSFQKEMVDCHTASLLYCKKQLEVMYDDYPPYYYKEEEANVFEGFNCGMLLSCLSLLNGDYRQKYDSRNYSYRGSRWLIMNSNNKGCNNNEESNEEENNELIPMLYFIRDDVETPWFVIE